MADSAVVDMPTPKLLYRIGNYRALEVDGKWVRDHREPKFTNFGQHFVYPKLIPMWDLWLDKEAHPDERPFFLTHLLVEHAEQAAGVVYDEALKKADTAERRERQKVEGYAGEEPDEEWVRDVQKEFLGTKHGVDIWLVRGKIVRDKRQDFTEGGHDLVYSFIPRGKGGRIWIDDDVFPKERPPTIGHEFGERLLMSLGWSYAKAHIVALQLEWGMRHSF